MQRREFLKSAPVGGIGLLGVGEAAAGQAGPGPAAAWKDSPALPLRPYQLLCLICALGEEASGNAS